MRTCLRLLPAILVATPALADGPPTYHKEISRLIRKHCQECHRPGQVAPFALMDYSQARKRAADLLAVAEDRRMPPWHASTELGGPFRDVRALSDGEIALLQNWVKADCPEGDPADAPPPATYHDDWPLGPPDLVLKPGEPFRLDASGSDDYRVFVLPTGLTEGKWIAAVDFRPGNPKVVHHILGAFDRTGAARKLDQADEGPGYRPNQGFGINPVTTVLAARIGDFGGMSGWAPGKSPRPLPSGIGRYLPAGSDILLQVHYHKSGKVEDDQTAIGLYFAKGTIDKQVVGGAVFPPRGKFIRPDMEIPAGDPSYEVAGRMSVNEDSHLIGIIPHMHLLGKDFKLTATLPDGSERTLIWVDRWDFNWQDVYEFADPVALPKGTTVKMVAHFDNSAGNPSNPSKPPKAVRWGEQTTDEMCIGFLQMTRDAEKLGGKVPERPAGASLFGGDR